MAKICFGKVLSQTELQATLPPECSLTDGAFAGIIHSNWNNAAFGSDNERLIHEEFGRSAKSDFSKPELPAVVAHYTVDIPDDIINNPEYYDKKTQTLLKAPPNLDLSGKFEGLIILPSAAFNTTYGIPMHCNEYQVKNGFSRLSPAGNYANHRDRGDYTPEQCMQEAREEMAARAKLCEEMKDNLVGPFYAVSLYSSWDCAALLAPNCNTRVPFESTVFFSDFDNAVQYARKLARMEDRAYRGPLERCIFEVCIPKDKVGEFCQCEMTDGSIILEPPHPAPDVMTFTTHAAVMYQTNGGLTSEILIPLTQDGDFKRLWQYTDHMRGIPDQAKELLYLTGEQLISLTYRGPRDIKSFMDFDTCKQWLPEFVCAEPARFSLEMIALQQASESLLRQGCPLDCVATFAQNFATECTLYQDNQDARIYNALNSSYDSLRHYVHQCIVPQNGVIKSLNDVQAQSFDPLFLLRVERLFREIHDSPSDFFNKSLSSYKRTFENYHDAEDIDKAFKFIRVNHGEYSLDGLDENDSQDEPE